MASICIQEGRGLGGPSQHLLPRPVQDPTQVQASTLPPQRRLSITIIKLPNKLIALMTIRLQRLTKASRRKAPRVAVEVLRITILLSITAELPRHGHARRTIVRQVHRLPSRFVEAPVVPHIDSDAAVDGTLLVVEEVGV